MRYLPHQIFLMALEGHESIHGTPLPSTGEALLELQRMTGQAIGPDPEAWSAWIKANRKGLYKDAKGSGIPARGSAKHVGRDAIGLEGKIDL